MGFYSFLKPSNKEIMEIARKEVQPDLYYLFAPICKGPFFAVLMLLCIAIASLPIIFVKFFVYVFRKMTAKSS